MQRAEVSSKIPEVTLLFWIMKIAATTLGETGGDTVTMSMGLGYAQGSLIFLTVFVLAIACQILAHRFHRWLYWTVIVATTTLGTTIADFADRSLGIGYAGGSSLLLVCLIASFVLWRQVTGSVSLDAIGTRVGEAFYWVTIMLSQTLGTALGDWTADSAGLGFGGSAIIFAAALAILAIAYFGTRISRTLLFWLAFILTRPLGATTGDLLDKPLAAGGFALSRPAASAVIATFLAVCLIAFHQRPAPASSAPQAAT